MSEIHDAWPPEAQPKPRDADCPAHDTRCTPDECRVADLPGAQGFVFKSEDLPSGKQPEHVPTFRLATLDDVLDTFAYHKPTDEQVERISNIREGAKAFARVIWANVTSCPDRTVALRMTHEAMMTANKAIVCEVPGG